MCAVGTARNCCLVEVVAYMSSLKLDLMSGGADVELIKWSIKI